MGAPNKKNGGCPIRIPKAFAFWGVRQAGGFASGQPPLHFLAALECGRSEDRSVNRILRRLKLQADCGRSAHCA